MAIGTIAVHGSSGEVMAPFGKPGTFIKGRRVKVTVLDPIKIDESIPEITRNALVGLTVETIFTAEQVVEMAPSFKNLLPPESRLAYVAEVVEVLKSAGRNVEAEALRRSDPSPLGLLILDQITCGPPPKQDQQD